ncbi:LOW QUALITY PROTEIN: uncharacterized protein LOC130436741 [Triplophysa dalaica]|uniref:LOW QUALITY PROTEIN: uncharacterized protein LOC130436741 n=1 Tax=Triplophysa dalaica TaxID=1582913 RepID=UPI0024DFBB07|nr:LOW QUALITY PROTEIN: uncharacterized protein LOC130436741 [Triplophysa dalaica]
MSETHVIDDASANCNPPAPTSASHRSSSGSDSIVDSPASSRGRQLRRSACRKAKARDDTSSPAPERRPPHSPASSYTSTHNTIPAIQKWTVQGLRMALSKADVDFSRRMTKAELYGLYASSLADTAPPKSAPQMTTDKPGTAHGSPYSRPGQSTNAARRGRPLASRHSRPSASAGTATDLALDTELHNRVFLGVRNISCAFTDYLLTGLSNGFDPGVISLPLHSLICPNLQSALADPESVDVLIKKEIHANFIIGPFDAPPFTSFRISPIDIATPFCLPEVQAAGTRSRPFANTGTSLFGADILVNHPLKTLLNASLNSNIQAVSLRTLQSYLTAWKSFKSFHLAFNIPFPDFSVLTITSFISFLNSSKNLQASSIKGYMSGVEFFHKLIFNSPSAAIASSQTSMLIKGIQRTHPARQDARQPITLDILTRCISTLRKGYHSKHVDHTLDTMFILAFFGFLRCSEISTTSTFNPLTHPTVSDLSVVDSETMSFSIKQSKTDQTRRGHFIYIFNLHSPIQPYQTLLAYLHFRKSQTKTTSDPLFVDESNRPATRFWFQKHLKAVLLLSGIPADHFSGHSFRIGASTTAAQKGLSHSQIQALGRWTSEAFKSYIRSDRSIIREAHRTLISKII